MNTATVRGRRAPKRPPISGLPEHADDRWQIAALRRYVQAKIFFSDDLRRRWEQIVSKERS